MKVQSLLGKEGKIFGNFESSIFEVIGLAIGILNKKDHLPTHEGEINRCFYFCLVDTNWQL